MSNTVTIEIENTQHTIDAELFREYRQRAFEALDDKKQADADFKEEVDTLAETTGIKKGLLSKYFKTSHAAKIKAMSAEADVFETLDGVVKA